MYARNVLNNAGTQQSSRVGTRRLREYSRNLCLQRRNTVPLVWTLPAGMKEWQLTDAIFTVQDVADTGLSHR